MGCPHMVIVTVGAAGDALFEHDRLVACQFKQVDRHAWSDSISPCDGERNVNCDVKLLVGDFGES